MTTWTHIIPRISCIGEVNPYFGVRCRVVQRFGLTRAGSDCEVALDASRAILSDLDGYPIPKDRSFDHVFYNGDDITIEALEADLIPIK